MRDGDEDSDDSAGATSTERVPAEIGPARD